MRFKGKVALITGGGSGIGEAACFAFAKEGAGIGILDINITNAEKVENHLKEIGCTALAVQANVANYEEVRTAVQKIYSKFKHIDILVNGAGYGHYVLLSEMSEAEWDDSIAVNLKGPFNCTRAVINGMISQKSGKIVNISSVAGIVGAHRHTQYSAAKAGVIGMSKGLAKEVASFGINVNVLAPALIDTDFYAPMKKEAPEFYEKLINSIPLGRMGTAQEMAATILFLCSEDAAFFTGQVLSPSGGFMI